MSELTFREEGGFMKAVAEVTLAAAEDTGARSSIKPEKLTLSIPVADWEKARGQAFVHRGQLKTGKGNIRFVAGVRDVASGRMALASVRPPGRVAEPPAHRSEAEGPGSRRGLRRVAGSVEGPTSSVPEPSPQAPCLAGAGGGATRVNGVFVSTDLPATTSVSFRIRVYSPGRK